VSGDASPCRSLCRPPGIARNTLLQDAQPTRRKRPIREPRPSCVAYFQCRIEQLVGYVPDVAVAVTPIATNRSTSP
jgi:hypothetical protein